MILTCTIKLDLGDAFTPYDRLALGDMIVHDIRTMVSKRKDVKLVEAKGVIESEGKVKE